MNTEQFTPLFEGIRKTLLTGELFESTLHFPVKELMEAIEQEFPSFKKKEHESDNGPDGWSTNGWQWDWWQRFENDGKCYILHGSGYYGGLSFGGAEDET